MYTIHITFVLAVKDLTGSQSHSAIKERKVDEQFVVLLKFSAICMMLIFLLAIGQALCKN